MTENKHLLQNKPLILAGPCAVESREQILSIGEKLHGMGITVMRCQLWKPRSTPDNFQGVGSVGLPWLAEVKEKYGMTIATELVDAAHLEETKGIVDVLWIGARNMQNYELLKKVGADGRPVILKRGLIATVDEWMSAAKYIGTEKVILCERGIRTGADAMRFTLDLNAMLVAKHDFNMPVIIDPSHTAGRADMVPHLAYAGIAAGADGLAIEVHENPKEALSDNAQQITPEVFEKVYLKVKELWAVVAQTEKIPK